MNLLLNLALLVQILSALALIGVILIQHGQGADMGTGFGSGASGSLFGASGGATVLSHTTAVLATIFLATTLALAYFGHSAPSAPSGGSVLERAPLVLPQGPADAVPSDAVPSDADTVPAPAMQDDGSVDAFTPPADEIPDAAAAAPAVSAPDNAVSSDVAPDAAVTPDEPAPAVDEIPAQ